jgi:tetratricopeptide (TPR) repeat protein
LKRYDPAIDYCRQSLRYDAKDPYVHYALGLIYARKAQASNSREMLAAAGEHFRTMLALNNQMAEADEVKKMLVSFDAALAK